MSLKDIEKLREKVQKDPNSKLFVPLAEEYRKEGMLDDAVSVLLEGIGRQPAYMSARVSLGKIYLEKGLPKEARAEFEEVIKAIPDNLYAHKKLAEIYRDSGETDLAIKSYRTIMKLNAMDEDALAMLSEMEGRKAELLMTGESPAEEAFVIPEPASHDEPAEPEFKATEEPREEAAEATADEDFHTFKNAIFGDRGGSPESGSEEEILTADEVFEAMPEEATAVDELEFEVAGEIENEEAEMAEAEPEKPSLGAHPEERDSGTETAESLLEETTSPAGTRDTVAASPETGDLMAAADRSVAEGDYPAAMNTYRKMLSSSPDDRRVLQRMEELKFLLRFMGKDKEYLVNRLTGFLDTIRKRRDGLPGSS
jgi:tetratricopeptide (TPR) repeat protein